MKLAILALILATVFFSCCVQSIPTLTRGEKISLDKNTAESVLKNYTEQYLEKMNINFKIDKIEAEFGESNSGILGVEHPSRPGKIYDASSYLGTVFFSNETTNGILKFLYDATAPFGFVCNANFCNIFVTDDSCISDNSECILGSVGDDFRCSNLMYEQNLVPEEVSKYFSCICNKTGENTLTTTNTTYNVSNDSEFFNENNCVNNESMSCGCTNKENSMHDCFITKSIATYNVRACSLDFSLESNKSQDNKVILVVNTPKDVPSVNIIGEKCEITGTIPGLTPPSSECNKNCEQIVNLKKGTNEIKTECDYTESGWECIRLYYNQYKIAEVGCMYLA